MISLREEGGGREQVLKENEFADDDFNFWCLVRFVHRTLRTLYTTQSDSYVPRTCKQKHIPLVVNSLSLALNPLGLL